MTRLLGPGDEVHGDKIFYVARRIDKGPVVHGSGSHRTQTATAKENATCTIDIGKRLPGVQNLRNL